MLSDTTENIQGSKGPKALKWTLSDQYCFMRKRHNMADGHNVMPDLCHFLLPCTIRMASEQSSGAADVLYNQETY